VTLLLLDAMASVSNLRFTDQDDGASKVLGQVNRFGYFMTFHDDGIRSQQKKKGEKTSKNLEIHH
jgi:hypothetical protein